MEKAERKIIFPFTAIVGQEKAKLALLCVAINPAIGGVLLSGDKGTGKSTLVRALADLLPEIEVVANCPFNCNPRNSLEMCDACLTSYGSNSVVIRKMKIVDLPLSVTVDSLVGTLEIKRALKEGIRALQPGLLAMANRNILYIDEVNLLDDYVADVLLDAAAMGWNIIEREGISIKHPARFILVGSMNPEEGELRPQLLDRFGLFVSVEASKDPQERVEIVKRVEEFQRDSALFYSKWEEEQRKLKSTIKSAIEILPHVTISDELLNLVAETIVNLGIKTHRAEIVTVKTAKTIAALNSRTWVNLEDLKKAMELALPHRIKSKPFDQMPPLPPLQLPQSKHNEGDREKMAENEKGTAFGKHSSSLADKFGSGQEVFKPTEVEFPLNTQERQRVDPELPNIKGSRGEKATLINYPHGYPISYIPPPSNKEAKDIDIVATITTAACKLRGPEFKVESDDIMVRVRKSPVPKLICLLLDASGSMAAMKRMSVAKGVAKKIIENSYVKRDSVALIVFRGSEAEILVPPTRRYDQLLEALKSVPTGGKTPLPSALYTLLILAKRFKMKNKSSLIEGILISDGKANVPLRGKSVKESLEALSSAIRKLSIKVKIFDTRLKATIDPSPSYIEFLSQALNASVCPV